MHSGPDDISIISRVLQGEQQAYAELVKRYQNFVFSLCLRYAPAREDAEEIAQDVFVKAYRNLGDFRGEARFSTWLYTIVHTSCLTFLRKKRPDIKSLDDEHVFAAASGVAHPDAVGGARMVEQKSRVALVNRAIQLLGADDARVLTLFYKGEQSLEEIGRIMGMELNTIKVKLHRARQRLREKMEKHFTEELKDLV
ncbi:MAG: sigma-70 family RNA polymerase sigma factor [Bacteroidetes bacterium]|nr:sigma-70 family RNA polymerase sigma factor [Bacteroidota bacterium]